MIILAKDTTLVTSGGLSLNTPSMPSEAASILINPESTKIKKNQAPKWYIGFVVHQTPVEVARSLGRSLDRSLDVTGHESLTEPGTSKVTGQ